MRSRMDEKATRKEITIPPELTFGSSGLGDKIFHPSP
jgi:hypothetical protein